MNEGAGEKSKEGRFNGMRHRGRVSNKPSSSSSSSLLLAKLNPINHPFIVPSLPEHHPLIMSMHIFHSSTHQSLIGTGR